MSSSRNDALNRGLEEEFARHRASKFDAKSIYRSYHEAEVATLRADRKAFRGASIVFAVALIVSIIAHVLRSAS